METTEQGRSNRSIRFVSVREYNKLLLAAIEDKRGYWHSAITCAWCTGFKLHQVALLKWDAIDWTEETITIELVRARSETMAIRMPLQSDLYEILQPIRRSPRDVFPGPAYVFPDMARTYMIDRHRTLCCQFGRLCKKARLEGIGFVCFHRTFVRDLLRAGVDPHTVACITGVSDLRRIGKFAPLPLDAKRRALHKMQLFRVGFRTPFLGATSQVPLA